MVTKPKIYISLPITGREQEAREKADLVKAAFSKQGYPVVSPFDIYPGENPTYDDHICNDLRAMLDCDAVYFCEGWEHSCGCNIEYAVANAMNFHGKKAIIIMKESDAQKLNS